MTNFVLIAPGNGKIGSVGHVVEIWGFTENKFVFSMDSGNTFVFCMDSSKPIPRSLLLN